MWLRAIGQVKKNLVKTRMSLIVAMEFFADYTWS